MTIIPKTPYKASVYRHLAVGGYASQHRQRMTERFFGQSCKRSLDEMARRAYIQGVDKRGAQHMRIISDIIDALAAAAFVAGVICLAIALNP